MEERLSMASIPSPSDSLYHTLLQWATNSFRYHKEWLNVNPRVDPYTSATIV